MLFYNIILDDLATVYTPGNNYLYINTLRTYLNFRHQILLDYKWQDFTCHKISQVGTRFHL